MTEWIFDTNFGKVCVENSLLHRCFWKVLVLFLSKIFWNIWDVADYVVNYGVVNGMLTAVFHLFIKIAINIDELSILSSPSEIHINLYNINLQA